MNKKTISSLALGILLIGLFSASTTSWAVDYYWDTTAGAGNGTGGNGTFTTATNLWSLTAAGDATLVANTGTTNDVSNFQGTAGTVSWSNNLIQGAFNINTNGYTFTTASASVRTLGIGNVTLGNSVNLNLSSYSTSALKFQSNSIIGGTGSTITLVGGTSGKRVVLLDSGATVASSAPVIFNITGTLPVGDYMALGNSSATGIVNSTITGNSGLNDMTFYSAGSALQLNGSISGSQGVAIAGNGLMNTGHVDLTASNSYVGKTTLYAGAVYVSNNFAFSTNSVVVASNSAIRGITTITGVLTTNQIANAIEFGTLGANLSIGTGTVSNSISFNGIISGSGSVSAGNQSGAFNSMLMNTNNTFTGGVSVTNYNTLYVANLGNKADTKSAIGTGATITLGSLTSPGTLRWLGSAGNEISDKDFVVTGVTGGANTILANGPTNATLTLSGNFFFPSGGPKTLTLAGYSTNTLTVGGLIPDGTNGVIYSASTYTSGSGYKYSIASNTGLATNCAISGPGIPPNTTITNFSTTSIYLDKPLSNSTTVITNGTVWSVSAGTTNNSTPTTNAVTLSADVLSPNQISAVSAAGIATNSTMTGLGIPAGTTVSAISGNYISLSASLTNLTAVSAITTSFTNSTATSVTSLLLGTSSSGTIILGNTNNSFSGPITLIETTGSQYTTLQTASIGNSNSPSPLGKNGTINFGGSVASAYTILKYTGTGETSDKVINLSAANAGAILDQSGATGNLKFTSAITSTVVGAKTITLQGSTSGTGEIASNIAENGNGVLGLTKDGSGTWTLSGTNSFTGVVKNQGTNGVLRFSSTNAMPAAANLDGNSSSGTYTLEMVGSSPDYKMNQLITGYMTFKSTNGPSTLTFTNATTGSSLGGNSSKVLTALTNATVVIAGPFNINGTNASSTRTLTLTGEGAFIFNGTINGSTLATNGLIKASNGITYLNASNNYNGGTQVQGGTLVINHSNAVPSVGSVTISNGATLQVNANLTSTVASTIANSGTVQVGSGGSIDASQISGGTVVLAALTGQANLSLAASKSLAALNLSGKGNISMPLGVGITSTGIVGVSGANNLLTLSGSPSVQTYILITGSSMNVDNGSISAVVGGQTIALGSSATVNGFDCAFQKTSTALQLVVSSAGAKTLTYDSLTNGGWNLDSNNLTWTSGSTPTAFTDGDFATFTTANNVTVTGNVQPGTLTFSLASGDLNFTGGSISAGTLTSSGAGNVTVGGALSVTGALAVSNGSLTLNSNVSTGSVSVSGGTLGGSGSLTAGVGGYTLTGGTVNMTLAGSGPLNLSGSVTIGGNNGTFSGPITIGGGSSISLTGVNGLGTGGLSLSGGAIVNLNTDGMTISNAIQLGAGGGGASVPSSVSASLTGGITNTSGSVNLTFSKSGAGKLIQTGALGASTGSIALNITGGDLVLQSGDKYLTNSQISTGAKLWLDGITVNTRAIKMGGPGTIEVTNNVVWTNSIGSTSITNAVTVNSGSKLSVGTSTNYVEFLNGILGLGNYTATAGGTNRITGNSTVAYMTIDSGGRLMFNNATASNTVITNNGTLDINISSSITNITGLSSGNTYYNGAISGNGNISITGSQNIYLAGNISGSNNVSLDAGSTGTQVILSGSNNFTGGINFAHATARSVWFGNSNALGSGTISNSTSATANLGYSGSANTADYTFANAIVTGTMNTAILSFQPGVSNSVRLGGVISGAGNLKITSSQDGTLYLNNANNTYSGGTEIGTGKIGVGSDGTFGATTGAVNFGTTTNSWLVVTSNVSFNASRNFTMSAAGYTANIDTGANAVTFNGALAPTTSGGNLNKIGSGSLTLAGVASYTGTTTLAAGTLNLGGNTITNTALTITTGTLTNGSIKVDASSTGITLNGSSTIAANLSGGADFTLGSVTNITNRLSGSNSFSGLIVLGATNNQTLEVTGTNALSTAANLQGASALSRTPTLSLLSGGNYKMNRYKDGNILFVGTNATTTSLTFTNLSGNTMTGGDKAITASNVVVTFTGDIDLAANKLQKTQAFAGNSDYNLNGIVSNSGTFSGGIVMKSSGTMTLSANNTYNDATSVENGTLVVAATGSLPATASVSVSSGAKLKFNQSSVGISVGAMTVAGNLEQNLITITSSGAVDLTGSSLKVNGAPSASSYTLVTGSSLTGTPTLSSAIPNYKLSNSINSLYLVAKATPVVVVTPGTYTYSGSTQGPSTGQVSTGGSTGAIGLSYSGTTSSGATYGPSATPPTVPGSYTVTTTTAEDATYASTSTATGFMIGKATQTITGLASADSKVYGAADYTLAVTKGASSSALSFASSEPSVATIDATTGLVHVVGAGTTTLTVNQAADANYNAAPAVTQTLTVTASAPTGLSYNSPSINGTIGTAIADLTPAVTGSGVTYSIDPALPSGLLLNPTTGVISGTPSVTSASAIYTVTATNVGGSTTTALTIGVGYAVGPVAVNDALTKSANNGSILIPVSDLLVNDYRITNSSGARAPDGDGLTVTAVTSGSGNTAVLNGVFIRFTPSSASTDTFTYTVSDGTKSATGTVTVTTETEAPVFNLQIVQVGTAALLGGATTVTHDFIGVPNQTYLVEYTTDLQGGVWTSVGNQNTGANGSFSVHITKSGDFVSEWNAHMFFRGRLVR